MFIVIYSIALVFLLGVVLGGLVEKARVASRKRLENKIRVQLEKNTLEDVSTKNLSDEFFEREEAWDIVADKARKGL